MEHARGFSVLEAGLVVVVIGVAVALMMPLVAPRRTHGARQLKDAAQIRAIHQEMTLWAGQHKGLYPLPSAVDRMNATVKEEGAAKDTTANVVSLLIAAGGVAPEMFISPAEADTDHITDKRDYEYKAPTSAVDPQHALWDPSFSADFTGTRVANNSYAHAVPGGARRDWWQDTAIRNWPVIGNRGPEIASIADATTPNPSATLVNPKSFTLLIHGTRMKWEGNVAYGDGSVSFETTMFPEVIMFKGREKKWARDCLFFDEPENDVNAFFGVFTHAGSESRDFKAAWD